MKIDLDPIRIRWDAIKNSLSERGKRIFCAGEVNAIGYGGLQAVSSATGIARSTIGRGLKDLAEGPENLPGKVRRPGGGRKLLVETDPTIVDDLRTILEPATVGDPMRPLLWVSKSMEKLAAGLREFGHEVCATSVSAMLVVMGYRRQFNRKTLEGGHHPDRNAQFEFICEKVQKFQSQDQPVISVDTKKKESIGPYKNGGSDYRPKGQPEHVKVHDFVDKELGKVAPYGVYDLADNVGFVNVGINADTGEFAVNSIRRWYAVMGSSRYPLAKRLMITADGGGSNGSRVRLWKIELQKLADELGIEIAVCHFPPGTSKWNKIEHRMFCHITQNWRGKPLTSRLAVVELIGATTTKTGLTIRCELDENVYEKGLKISDKEMDALNIAYDDFHPEWNYTILPRLRHTE